MAPNSSAPDSPTTASHNRAGDETRGTSPVLFAALLLIIAAAFVLLARQMTGVPESGDLRAVWLAGKYYPSDDLGSVYRLYDGVFSMAPPDVWIADIQTQGIETPVYPFIYPPLWAWAMSWIVPLTTMDAFGQVMALVNPCLMFLCAFLALRIAAPKLSPLLYLAIGLAIALNSFLFLLPLAENQPQILVAFFTLLGIERARNGAPVWGGLALAFAASMKVYPVIFAFLWLASGQKRATYSFALFGGSLGLFSIVVAGWPMHAAFLSELSAISKTALVSRANFSLDPLIAVLTIPPELMSSGDTSVTGGQTSWHYVAKSGIWMGISNAIQLLTFVLLLVIARRTRMQDPLLWPFAIIAVAWVSPLSWVYHYMAAMFFLPSLIDRLGGRLGVILIVAIVAPTHVTLILNGFIASLDSNALAIWNNAAFVLAAACFAWLAMRSGKADPA
ncbi:MAG: glycosyltransferase family 87 protein [Paracoccaceae bacterium]